MNNITPFNEITSIIIFDLVSTIPTFLLINKILRNTMFTVDFGYSGIKKYQLYCIKISY